MAYILAVWNKNLRTCYSQTGGGISSTPQPCAQNSEYIAFLEALTTSGGWVFNNVTLDSPTGMVATLGRNSSGSGTTPLPTGAATEAKQDEQLINDDAAIGLLSLISGRLSSLLSETSTVASNTNNTKNAILSTLRTRKTPLNVDGVDATLIEKINAEGNVVSSEYRTLDGSLIFTSNKILSNATANIWQNLTLVFESVSGTSLVSKFERATSEVGELNGTYNTLWVTMQAKDLEFADVVLYGRDAFDNRVILPYHIERFLDDASTQIVSLKANISGIFRVTLEMVKNSTTGLGYNEIVFNASTVSTNVSPNQINTQMSPVIGFRDLYDNHDFLGTIPLTTERILLSILSWLGYSGGETIGALLDRISTQLPNRIGKLSTAESMSVTLATGETVQNLESDIFLQGVPKSAALENLFDTSAIVGTPTDAFATNMANMRRFTAQIVASSTASSGAFIFEGSNNNGSWIPIPVYNETLTTDSLTTTNQTVTANSNYYFSGAFNFRYIRCRIATVIGGGGTLTAFVKFSTQNFIPRVQTATQATAGNLQMTATQGAASASALWLTRTRGANTGGLTTFRLISAATTNATSVKTTAATLYKLVAQSTGLLGATVYLKLYNTAAAPTVGSTVPVATYALYSGATLSLSSEIGDAFSTGLAFAITANPADTDTTAITANSAFINLSYA